MILDQNFLGLRDGFFHRMQLLGQFQAGTMLIHHVQDAAQMAFRALEPLGHGIVMVVGICGFHRRNHILPGRMCLQYP
ncbi:hypothetical protein D9M69_721220 [compost metagenome]